MGEAFDNLFNENINTSILEFGEFDNEYIREYVTNFTDEQYSDDFLVTPDNLEKINNFLNSIYLYLTKVNNAFELYLKLRKYYDEDFPYLVDYRTNLVNKFNTRDPYQLLREMFIEFVQEYIEQLVCDQIIYFVGNNVNLSNDDFYINDLIRQIYNVDPALASIHRDAIEENIFR